MCNVEDIFSRVRARRYHLEPTRPAGFAYATLDCFSSDPIALVFEFLRRGNGQCDVPQLVSTDKRGLNAYLAAHYQQRITCHCSPADTYVFSAAGGNRRHIGNRIDTPRTMVEDRVPDHVIRFRLLRQGHYGSAVADDSRLFAGDFCDGVS